MVGAAAFGGGRAVIFAQMVDDPSEHTETLLTDPGKKRAATQELAKRREAWSDRKAKHEKAVLEGDRSVPSEGPEPTLQECVADIERERLFEVIRQLVLWENTTNEKVLQQARDEIWQSWRYTSPRTPVTRGRRSCSTATSCPPSTTRSQAAGQSRWRLSGSGWRATPAT